MSTAEALENLYQKLLRHYGPQHWWPADTPLEVMVGAVLTQNTAWKNVDKAIANLKREDLLSLRALLDLEPERLAELIRPAGYYKLKTGRLLNLLNLVDREYEGDLDYMFSLPVDRLREDLLATKGIGPETADSILLYAGGLPVFVIDTYTARVVNRHGLADPSMGYFELQELFSDSLPAEAELYNQFHALLVRLGNDRCKKSKPRCEGCPAADWAGGPQLEQEW
jgi:endonuclease III related protein